MEKKFLLLFGFLLVLFFSIVTAQPSVCDWRGYITINGVLVNTSHVVTSYTNGAQATNGTVFSDGYYILPVPGNNGDNVTFRVCGVVAYPTNVTNQNWSCSDPGYHLLNLSITTLSDSSSCAYNCGCSGGYCCSGICYTGSCPTAAPATIPSGGGGGGGVATTIKITTTTAVASVTTTVAPPATTTILATTTTTVKKPKPGKLEIPGIPTAQVIGILVGVVAIITLVVFILVRFQSIKTRESNPTV